MEFKEENDIAERDSNSNQNVDDENSTSCYDDFDESIVSGLAPLPMPSLFSENKQDSMSSFVLSKRLSYASINIAQSNYEITKERRQSMLNWKQEEMDRKLMDLGKN